MIKHYSVPANNGKTLVTMHLHVCNQDTFFNLVVVDTSKADRWLLTRFRDAYAKTALSFIHQRRIAYSNTTTVNMQIENALAMLEMRFNGLKCETLKTVCERIVRSKQHLETLLPSPTSRYRSWRDTITEMIAECDSLLKANNANNKQNS